jgi:cytochrome bd ubiquinol oxidase subunit II
VTTYFAAILGLSILLYVLLDGFDLGVGILFGLTRDPDDRRSMLASISPVWDGNETWLVMAGTLLWGAFPRAYAIVVPAFYLPIVLMLGALILRGVAFEFRYKARGSRAFWDAAFSTGSFIVAFVQGTAVGAIASGIAIDQGQYVGGPFAWLSPFSALCGLALCFGYMLLGLGWIIGKAEGSLREKAYRRVKAYTCAVGLLLIGLFVYSMHLDLPILNRWTERPYLAVFPMIGTLAALTILFGRRDRRDFRPFILISVAFIAAFGTFAVSFLPYMLPFSLTIDAAAAPPSSLRFMFWGSGLVVLPLILFYTVTVYRVFRGKLVAAAEY